MKWIIVFSKSANYGPWRLFTLHRPDFGHVYAVRYDSELDVWIRFECASERLNFELLRDEEADLLFHHISTNCTCVEIAVDSGPIYFPRWLYCVSFVKHIVGCNKISVCTPYQLYCELIKNGGRVLFGESIGDSNG